jgi:hypothetical protein
MRQMLAALVIVGIAAPALAGEPKPAPKAEPKPVAEAPASCEYRPQQAVLRGQQNRPMRLTEAPRARMERAVNRRINGCVVPVIVPNGVEGK